MKLNSSPPSSVRQPVWQYITVTLGLINMLRTARITVIMIIRNQKTGIMLS